MELFNDKDETKRILCGQNTKQPRNNAQRKTETTTGKEKATKVQAKVVAHTIRLMPDIASRFFREVREVFGSK